MEAVKVIRRFSHFKNEKVIQEDVTSLSISDAFANGIPTSYFLLLSLMELVNISQKKKQNQNKKCKQKNKYMHDVNATL